MGATNGSAPMGRTPEPGLLRSLLFAPASHERHSRKALESAADAAILDLEDAVPEADKGMARHRAAALLSERALPAPLALVRINALATAHAYPDLLQVVGPGLDGIVLPKTESAEDVHTLAWALTQLERGRGLAAGAIRIIPIVESARGLYAAVAIAGASPRVRTLNFGVGDFTLDTGMLPEPGNPGVSWARAQVALACRLAGAEPPIDTAHLTLDDHEGLEREALDARRLGFQGKACIHPDQLPVVHRVFTPTPAEVARAQTIVDRFEAALTAGVGALRVGPDFVDQPIAARAVQVLERARRAGVREEAP
ncbi:MAG TPA: CoA ester lyase [Candidatus Micrarchaeia archaeon]|nr:CoA ester lyase [Candidatus Micrarchaeia archaeon]